MSEVESAAQELMQWQKMLLDGNLSRQQLMAASQRAFELSAKLRGEASVAQRSWNPAKQASVPMPLDASQGGVVVCRTIERAKVDTVKCKRCFETIRKGTVRLTYQTGVINE